MLVLIPVVLVTYTTQLAPSHSAQAFIVVFNMNFWKWCNYQGVGGASTAMMHLQLFQ